MPALNGAGTRRVAVAWGIAMALTLLALAGMVNQGVLRLTDRVLLAAAQAPSGAPLDLLMWAISLLGTIEVTTVILLVLIVTTPSAEQPGWRRFVPLALFVLVTAIEVLGKDFVHQPPPPPELLRGPTLHTLGMATPNAFPSGHMTRFTMLAGLAALRLYRRDGRAAWLWWCVGAVWLMGFSRVYLAHHWPADVAGGILLGGLGVAVGLALSPPPGRASNL